MKLCCAKAMPNNGKQGLLPLPPPISLSCSTDNARPTTADDGRQGYKHPLAHNLDPGGSTSTSAAIFWLDSHVSPLDFHVSTMPFLHRFLSPSFPSSYGLFS
ncbi:hypothetical protein C8R44DRAFT_896012 [Mycena epipterygia]|nr:hypothetical protein C8R44DRAFT_896012 [Mycena epipterygia]